MPCNLAGIAGTTSCRAITASEVTQAPSDSSPANAGQLPFGFCVCRRNCCARSRATPVNEQSANAAKQVGSSAGCEDEASAAQPPRKLSKDEFGQQAAENNLIGRHGGDFVMRDQFAVKTQCDDGGYSCVSPTTVPFERRRIPFSLKVRLVKQIWRRSCKGPSATLGGVRCEQRRDSRAYSKCDW